MDHDRFDVLVRRLGGTLSRRTALGTSLAALLPLSRPPAGLEAEARGRGKQHKRKKEKCGACEVRRGKRKCKRAPDNKACKGEGRCRRGRCSPRPTCVGNANCNPTIPSQCCSGQCVFDPFLVVTYCLQSAPGQACYMDRDCVTGSRCIGYVCEATG